MINIVATPVFALISISLLPCLLEIIRRDATCYADDVAADALRCLPQRLAAADVVVVDITISRCCYAAAERYARLFITMIRARRVDAPCLMLMRVADGA